MDDYVNKTPITSLIIDKSSLIVTLISISWEMTDFYAACRYHPAINDMFYSFEWFFKHA